MNILLTTTGYEFTMWANITVAVGFLVIFLSVCIIGAVIEKWKLALIMFLTGAALMTVSFCKGLNPYDKFKVTFDDKYAVTELLKEYEIIEIEGKIVTLRKKEKDEQT